MRYGNIKQATRIIFEKVTKDDWDEVICIVGKNRRGKSNIGLTIVDEWLTLLKGRVEEEDTNKHIGIDAYGFAKVFKTVKKYEPVMHDEAGDLSNRNSMGKINKLYAQAYQIVAGENLLTILILPELWDLDPYFRKHRIRHLINVYERGKFHFWTNKRYDRIIARNANYPVKNYYVVKPAFAGTFAKYNGPLKKKYDQMKNSKLSSVRDMLDQNMKGLISDKKAERTEAIMTLVKKGVPRPKIAELMGLSERTIIRHIKKMTKT